MGNRINLVPNIDEYLSGESLWDSHESDEDREERWKMSDIIWSCLKDECSGLTIKQTECIMLYLEGKNKVEIGKIMGGISASSVAKHFNSAIFNIKLYIEQHR
jgi:hypothetical protein